MKKLRESIKYIFNRNKFDEINSVKQGKDYITYGIMHGDNTILFIKIGYHGSIYGYKHKYVKMAKKINKNHKCTVIVSSNPNGYSDFFEGEINSIKAYAYYHHFDKYQIFYFGHSAGAILGMMHVYKYPEIKKVLLINPPIYNNENTILLDSIKFGITKFNKGKMHIILGTKDYSFLETEKLYESHKEKIQIHKIIGADHNFKNKLKLFINLPELFFYSKNEATKIINLKDLSERLFEIDNMLNAGEITEETAEIEKNKAVDELNSAN